ncbi:MAG: CheR family methyltransferase, partial [Verrucomicrobiota bacterium]
VLRSATGVDFSFYKQSTLKRRIARRMAVQKLSSLPEYVQFLEKYPNEVDALYQDFLINVTHFFRDPKVFQALKKKVFPRLLKNRPDEAAIRIWVPGCSSGEEVYSLAIALLEYMDGTTRHNAAIQIFATDISETAIARARAGIYPQAIQGDVSEERLRRFFTKTDGGYQIAKTIRDACVFARQNVVEDPPFSKMDLISCRNLLIYLGPVLQRKVMPIFHYALNPGGFLLLGSSESVGTFSDLFKPVDKHHRIFSKNVVYNRPEVVFTRMPIPMEPKWAPKAAETPAEFGTLDVQRQVDNLILKRYSPNAVIVNSNLEVLGFRGRTGPFMEHASGEASLNLLKMVKEDLVVEVRTALARAMKQGATVRRESIRMQVNGTVCLVDIEVVPFGAPPSAERFFLVLFRATPMAQEKAEVLAPLGPSPSLRAARHEIGRLQEELRSSKESLQAIIEEQEATNEELKSANEEIQSSNEELQSTNEEMETAKEELQSTNEELTTLNDELQNRNQELSLLNNDLRNLLSSVNLPIIMLGSDLLIRRFTPQAEKLFNLIPSDIGRRISDINPNLQAPDLAPLVSQVIDSLKIQEIEVQDRQGQWYSLRIRPYRTSDNKIDGAVIVLVDIDDLKKSFEDISEVIAQPVLTLYGDFRIFRANAAFYRMFRLNREATEDQLIFDLEQGAWNQPALHTMLEGLLARNNRVENVRFEADFPSVGRKAFLVNARRVQQETKGTQLILIAFESIGGP